MQDIFSFNVEQARGTSPNLISPHHVHPLTRVSPLPAYAHTHTYTPTDTHAHTGDTHNMIVIVQHHEGLELQEAVDYVGDLCYGCIDRFEALRRALPSWGPEIDRQLQVYIDGLADWMIGNLVWSFETTRYFGADGEKVLRELAVDLLPRRK